LTITIQTSLQTFIQTGITIRVQNQALSKINLQVSRGLAQIEQSQVMEFAMANNLTGNAANDGPILNQLLQDLQDCLMKNKGLQSLVSRTS
jgi:hypothetical protein